jgi:hypothetical protein
VSDYYVVRSLNIGKSMHGIIVLMR